MKGPDHLRVSLYIDQVTGQTQVSITAPEDPSWEPFTKDFDTEEQARAWCQKLQESVPHQPEFNRMTMTPAGRAWQGGKSGEDVQGLPGAYEIGGKDRAN